MPVFKLVNYIHNKYLEKKSTNRKVGRGDIIGVSRILYDHYAVYVGDNMVIQYTKAEKGFKLEVRKTAIEAFLVNSTTYYILDFDSEIPHKSAPIKYRDLYRSIKVFSPEKTIKRAESRLGEEEYNLLSNNCEHFAIWCKTGISQSYQIEYFLKFVPKIKKRVTPGCQTTG